MRIKKILFLSDYKKFQAGDKVFFDTKRIISLVGQNGSGKTTIMSILSNFFYNLERYDEKIKFDVEIQYSIADSTGVFDISIKHQNNLVEISINGSEYNIVIPRTVSNQVSYKSLKEKFHLSSFEINDRFLDISDIKRYLPSNILGSVFSIHGEYPDDRNHNYIGELKHISHNFPLERLFGHNHWSVGNISLGILDIIQERKLFEKTFDLKWTRRIRIYDKQNEDISKDDSTEVGYWRKVNLTDAALMRKRIEEEKTTKFKDGLFINDIEFLKSDGRKITLNSMSAGEKFLFLRIMNLVNLSKENSLILIEEPELFLNPVWQRNYIDLLLSLFEQNCQVIFATHSPYILEGAKSLEVESYIFHRDTNTLDRIDLFHTSLEGSINFISYQAFGILSNALHIELFTILQIEAGGLKQLSKKLLQIKGMEKIIHTSTLKYGQVKVGDLVEEAIPVYIRNIIHHPEEEARSYGDTTLERSIKVLASLVCDGDKIIHLNKP